MLRPAFVAMYMAAGLWACAEDSAADSSEDHSKAKPELAASASEPTPGMQPEESRAPVPRLRYPAEVIERQRKRWREPQLHKARGPKGCDVSELSVRDIDGSQRRLALPEALEGPLSSELSAGRYRRRRALSLSRILPVHDSSVWVSIEDCRGRATQLSLAEVQADADRYLLVTNSQGTLKLVDRKHLDRRRLARDVIRLRLSRRMQP